MDYLPSIHPGPHTRPHDSQAARPKRGCGAGFSLQVPEFHINYDSCGFCRSDPCFSYSTPKGGEGGAAETPWKPELDNSKRICGREGGAATTPPSPFQSRAGKAAEVQIIVTSITIMKSTHIRQFITLTLNTLPGNCLSGSHTSRP